MPSAEEGKQAIISDYPTSPSDRRASLKILNRNIDQVVLGKLAFDAWYYSPYPDNIILGPSQHPSGKNPNHAEVRNGHTGGTNSAVKEGGPACPRLYVCPNCFRYTPNVDHYVLHLQHHETRFQQQIETSPVPKSALKVYEWEGYAVWEVDGEIEKLYCQNLSLFGKLFLEQKSVFFDTGGFKYYVLTYTPPAPVPPPVAKGRGRKRSSSIFDQAEAFKSQVLGFFSKENLSWDSNNLACILIFPPFQHRQLGKLLMAVSYKLSGWEWEGGIIGGPEKPLSTMGRKSYLRFWSERIARFIMGQTADADARKVFPKSRTTTVKARKEEMTIKDIGDRTGMLGEDVVAALNTMGICKVVPKKRKKKISSDLNGSASHAEPEAENLATMTVLRSKVVEWAEKNKVDLVSPVREEGFLGEWALSDIDNEDEYSGESSGGDDDSRDHHGDDQDQDQDQDQEDASDSSRAA